MRGRALLFVSMLLLAGGTQALGGIGEEVGETRTQALVVLETWPASSSLEDDLQRLDVRVEERFTAAKTLLVTAPEASLAALEHRPSVAGVYEDEPLELFLDSSKRAAGVSEQLQQANVTGEDVKIAIVDSGVAASHPGLEDEVTAHYTVDEDGVQQGAGDASKHGTHVAGILSGSGEGASPSRGDASGVAPGSRLVSLDISEDFTTSNALRAFEWIYHNHEEEDIHVVTNAWGRLESPATYDPDDPLVRASSALVGEGLITVFSAGNGGGEDSRMTVEATNPDVITVGASTDEGQVESYSSRGPVYDGEGEEVDWTKPDLVAPGSHVVSAQPAAEPGGAYITMNGTSMAAPHVAGTVALVLQQRPDLSPGEVKGLLVRGAQDVGPSGVDDASGAGMLDAESSLRILDESEGTMERKSRSSQHDSQLTGPGQAEVVFSQTDLDHEDAFRVVVPENATRLEVSIEWSGDGGLEATLERPDGSRARTASVEDRRSLTLSEPTRGEWTVRVEAQDVSQGTYRSNVTVTWLEPVNGTTIPFSSERSTGGSFPSTGGPLDPWEESWVPGVPNLVFMLSGAALTVTMIVGRIRD